MQSQDLFGFLMKEKHLLALGLGPVLYSSLQLARHTPPGNGYLEAFPLENWLYSSLEDIPFYSHVYYD